MTKICRNSNSHSALEGDPSYGTDHRWWLVCLLCVSLTMNFFVRGNLGVAAPVLVQQLHFSPWALGLLISGFFWTYSVGQIGGGWLVDRVEVRSAYAAAFFLWSLATFGTGLMTSFAGIFCMRLLLGVGESVAYPAISKILAATFPERRRGIANSIVDLGARLGPALGTYAGATLVAELGWRGLFFVSGSVCLLWLIPWKMIAPRIPPQSVLQKQDRIGWKQLLTSRTVWATVGGLCGANYAWYFLLSWLPSYLVNARHLSIHSMAIWGSVPYLFMAGTSLISAQLSDWLIAKGRSAVIIRKRFLAGGLAGTAIFLPAVLLSDLRFALCALFLSCITFGVYASNIFALTQTLAGPEAAGRWTGLQNAWGNVAGIISAVATGWFVEKTGQFSVAFLAASCSSLLGAVSFFLVRENTTVILGRRPAAPNVCL